LLFVTLRSEYKRSIVPIRTNSGSYIYYRICMNEHGWEEIYSRNLFIILEIPTFIEQLMNSTRRKPLHKLSNVIFLQGEWILNQYDWITWYYLFTSSYRSRDWTGRKLSTDIAKVLWISRLGVRKNMNIQFVLSFLDLIDPIIRPSRRIRFFQYSLLERVEPDITEIPPIAKSNL
jgi:hypothetical protein